jgi:CHASE2 domain-containing sensor protein
MSINYRCGAAVPRSIPLWHVLERLDSAKLRSLFEGKVIMVGSSLDGDTDFGPTPLQPSVAMVEAHAQAADTILQQAFVLPIGSATTIVIVLSMAVLVAAATSRFGPALGLVATAVIVAGYVGLAFWMFSGPTRRVYPLVGPPLAGIAAYLLEVIAQSQYHHKIAQIQESRARTERKNRADLTTS